jgi:hypothetical protein
VGCASVSRCTPSGCYFHPRKLAWAAFANDARGMTYNARMRPASYRTILVVLAGVAAAMAVVQALRTSYESAVVFGLLGGVLVLRITGVIPAAGLASRLFRSGLAVCPRCGKRMLAQADDSGVRHCWACGEDIPDGAAAA